MSVSAIGRIKIKLEDTSNKTFNEYPCYTSLNFLDDQQAGQADAQRFVSSVSNLISTLTSNTYVACNVEYDVSIDALS